MSEVVHYWIYDDKGNVLSIKRGARENIPVSVGNNMYIEVAEGVTPRTHKLIHGELYKLTSSEKDIGQAAKDETRAVKQAADIAKLETKCAIVKQKYPEVIDLLVDLKVLPAELKD